jgi:hypothetical protein
MRKFKPIWVPSILILLEIIHFLVRWMLLNSPFFSELDYDEGVIGLMALHILRGEPQLMLWGLPRMGGFEAYLASFIFYIIGPSTLGLQLSLVAVSSVILLVIYGLGKKVGGEPVGFIAAGYWALPPIFLSFTGNYAGGGHLEAVLAGSLILYGISSFESISTTRQANILFFLVGVISGVGWWSSLLIMPFLLVAVIGMMGTRPRLVFSPLPWLGAAGFIVGSLPFWTWNVFHDFNTLHHLGGNGIFSVFHQLPIVVTVTIPTLIGTFWDGQGVSSIPKVLTLFMLIVFYIPVLLIILAILFQWLWRLRFKKAPFQKPIDYVVLAFLAYFFIRASGPPDDLGLTRYTMALFVALSILVAFWIDRIFRFKKVFGVGLLFGLLGFNLLTSFLYMEQNKEHPVRPVDDLIRSFNTLGLQYCYSDSRISQVITFESKEKIICADYYGWRNYDYLKIADRAPAQELAIVTHRKLGNPYPEAMESSLQLLGAGYEKKEVGEYVFFYHFNKPGYGLRSIPAREWEVTASKDPGQCLLVKDRDILTAWRIPKRAGEWLQIDLGRVKRIGQLSLLSGPVESGLPYQFKLEISGDGRSWKNIREVKDYVPGLYWHNDHPRLDKNLRLQFVFPPQEGRYLRISNLSDVENPNDPWTIAELFVYETVSGINPIPEQALKNLVQAGKNLNHWMDDPTGPQPSPLGISLQFRKKHIDWQALIQSASRAIQEAPDWEEAHQLLGQALMLGDFWNSDPKSLQKSVINPQTLFSDRNFSLIPPTKWKVHSNVNNREARSAVDGNPFTRWTSLKNQEPGLFFQVDLGASILVNGFSLFLSQSINDFPRILKILSSSDGENWKEVQATLNAEYAFDQNQIFKKVTFRFTPIQSRYLKLIQNGSDPVFWWSIYELEIFNGTS